MKILKNKRGFSLVELMVVVAIMGVLSAIAIPSYLTYQDNAKEGVAESMLHIVDRTMAVELARGELLATGLIAGVWAKVQSNDKDEFAAPTAIVLGTGTDNVGNWCINLIGRIKAAATTSSPPVPASGGTYDGYYGCVSNGPNANAGKKIRVLKAANAAAADMVAVAAAGRCTTDANGALCTE